MSKISKAADKVVETKKLRLDETVTNFMGGDSYTINPLDTLKMVSASSIFGEPSYYRGSKVGGKKKSYAEANMASVMRDIGLSKFTLEFCHEDRSTDEVFVEAVDNALSYDFQKTLEWAVKLRDVYNMRLNPQVIIARAAMHPNRKEFTENNPGIFREYALKCMFRADDPLAGMAYFIYAYNGKNKMPTILKKAYADKLSSLDAYQVNKYKNAEIGMINGVRICHANSEVLNELMRNGTVEVEEGQTTWEMERSAGKSWEEVFQTVNMGHMALLRNLRGFFSEVTNPQAHTAYLDKLKSGVKRGKQFPFRYYSAYNAVAWCKSISDENKKLICDTLEECIKLSLDNMPRLKGRTAVLTDNSGSAWGTFESEYGTVTVADIDNLSAVITALNSDEGHVLAFGDRLIEYEIDPGKGIIEQTRQISRRARIECGGSTEGGIWVFFRDSIRNKDHWDNIFIYSDQQAGTGGLYGTSAHAKEYGEDYSVSPNRYSRDMINVFKLVLDYRKSVYKKVNVFSVQTAGYDNSVLPQYAYRTNLMYGWTGKESVFADIMIKQWDEVESH